MGWGAPSSGSGLGIVGDLPHLFPRGQGPSETSRTSSRGGPGTVGDLPHLFPR
ncbi:Hypothetical protein CAP_8917 [Chondromyces apiculatus DSM 436]|uniref:Uncharacterized protein n=1 Tax=Chondromyces apiculatus DSM 436 TaxID=1192034 RepID=A0A017SWA6_9BACT|nr:Hypothetical protein CAP_8917 [Chondromyces apiculatus DSM 436]